MRIKLLWAVNAALAVSVFFACALLARQYIVWRYGPSAALPATAAAPKPQSSGAVDLTYYESIGSSGLFGTARLFPLDRSAGANTGVTGITLLGTVVIKPGGYAIFQDRDSKKQELFKTGDMVFNLGKLTAVDKNMAIVRAGGRDLAFYMPEGTQSPAAPSGAGVNALKNSATPMSVQTGTSEWLIDQRAFSGILNDMGKVLGDARLQPYNEGRRVKGFSLSEIRPGGVFGLIGLKNGDVLLRINDFEIDSVEKGMQLLVGLKGETNLSLDILRDGKPIRLRYRIQ